MARYDVAMSDPRSAAGRAGPERAGGARLTIRRAAFLGFAVILVLWVGSGYDILQRLHEVEAHARATNARFLRAEELLSSVSRDALLSSIYLRDLLSANTPHEILHARQQLIETRRHVEASMAEYTALLGEAQEPASLTELRGALASRWSSLAPVFDPAYQTPSADMAARLRAGAAPRRESILRISEQIHAANQEAFERRQQEVGEVYRAAQQRVWIIGAVALVLSLGIATLVIVYARTLEKAAEAQFERDEENRRVLQRLSARLVHAQEDERRTIARELHDEVGQALTAVKTELGLAERRARASGASDPGLEEARGITDRALNTVRDLSQLLRPTLLDDLGLAAATDSLLRGVSRRTGIRADLEADGAVGRLATEVETCAYRIVQESVTNVARHADATAVRVTLVRRGLTLRIRIEDNGRGFDAGRLAASDTRGLGLIGMRERVSGLRGVFVLDTAPGRGTRIAVDLPALAPNAAGADAPEEPAATGAPAVVPREA